ncbi:hypothetical protein [Bacillus sp. REN16]|nr:hypothetical protein [Bacillus sp. REN16]
MKGKAKQKLLPNPLHQRHEEENQPKLHPNPFHTRQRLPSR